MEVGSSDEMRMNSRIRFAQAVLTTDGAFLLCYGAVSLLLAPGSAREPYFSSGRMFFGVLPALLGVGSLICAVWLSFARSRT